MLFHLMLIDVVDKHTPMRNLKLLDGWIDGWMDGWMDGKCGCICLLPANLCKCNRSNIVDFMMDWMPSLIIFQCSLSALFVMKSTLTLTCSLCQTFFGYRYQTNTDEFTIITTSKWDRFHLCVSVITIGSLIVYIFFPAATYFKQWVSVEQYIT